MSFEDWASNIINDVGVYSKIKDVQPEIIRHIQSIHDSGMMLGDFEQSTEKFVNSSSVTLIREILNVRTDNEELVGILNEILVAYLSLAKRFVFSDSRKLMMAIGKIVTYADAFFYLKNSATGYNFTSQTRPQRGMNVKAFVNSGILQYCTDVYRDRQDISDSVSCWVFDLFSSLRDWWDSRTYTTFVGCFTECFVESVGKWDDKRLRNCDEVKVSELFLALRKELVGDDLAKRVEDCEIDFYITMLKSQYLGKRFCALKCLMAMGQPKQLTIDKLVKAEVMKLLIGDMHHELIPGMVWLFGVMMTKGLCDVDQFMTFWKYTFVESPSSLREWGRLIMKMPRDIDSAFWGFIDETASFPTEAYSLIRGVIGSICYEKRRVVFDAAFRAVSNAVLPEQQIDEIILMIMLLLDNEQEFKAEAETLCFAMIKDRKNANFSLRLMTRMALNVDEGQAHVLFGKLMEITSDVLLHLDLYMSLVVRVLQGFKEPMDLDEVEQSITMLTSLVHVNCAAVQKFFTIMSTCSIPVLPPEVFMSTIRGLCAADCVSEEYVDLILCLFKTINKNQFSSALSFESLSFVSVSELVALEFVWEYVCRTSSERMAEFLACIYALSTDDSVSNMIMKCFTPAITYGALSVLLHAIRRSERVVIKDRNVQNEWRKPNGVIVTVSGGINCRLRLPISVTSSLLKEQLAWFLRTPNFMIYIDGKLPGLNIPRISSDTRVEVRATKGPLRVFGTISGLIEKGYVQKLVECLYSDDDRVAEAAFCIVRRLPTVEQERRLLESGTKWDAIFDTNCRWLILYRLNEIRRLAETQWVHGFVASGEAYKMFFKFVLQMNMYRYSHVLMSIVRIVTIADSAFAAAVTANDMSSLFMCLKIELKKDIHSAILIMRLFIAILEARASNQFVDFGIDTVVVESIFDGNATIRKHACDISRRFCEIKTVFHMIGDSCCEFSSDYFELLKDSMEKESESEVFGMILCVLSEKLGDCNATVYQAFLDGAVSVLENVTLKFVDEAQLEKLARLLLDKVLFTRERYFARSAALFKVMTSIVEASDVVKSVIVEVLDSSHVSFQGGSARSNATLSSATRFKGLTNLGATCYANATFQQLFYVPEFRQAVLAGEYDASSWLFQLQLLFAKLEMFPSSNVNAKTFFDNWKTSDQCVANVRQQQDAVEFLQLILDRIGDISEEVVSVFRGEIQHDTVGVSAKYMSSTEEKFTTFGMDVGQENNIEESLDTFLVPDHYTDYKTDEFGKIDVQRFHKISKAPTVLILQLRRFRYDLDTGMRVKVGKKYVFPHVLDLTRGMQTQDERVEYDLSGVMVHIGTANAGHYYSYCNVGDGEWRSFNDSFVQSFDEKKLPDIVAGGSSPNSMFLGSMKSEDTAYVLFYRKRGSQKPTGAKMNENVKNEVSIEIANILLSATLSDANYSMFALSIGDGPFLLRYLVKCWNNVMTDVVFNSFVGKCSEIIEHDQAFANTVINSHDDVFQMLAANDNRITRGVFAAFVTKTMKFADDDCVNTFVEYILSKLPESVMHWRNYGDLFLPLLVKQKTSMVEPLLDFLVTVVPGFSEKRLVYERVDMSNVFKVLLIASETDGLHEQHIDAIFGASFLEAWLQSKQHALSCSRLLRSCLDMSRDRIDAYTGFIEARFDAMTSDVAAVHFAVVIPFVRNREISRLFKFVSAKPALFIEEFLNAILSLVDDNKKVMSRCLIFMESMWTTWLFSVEPGLRTSTKNLLLGVFESDDVIRELLSILLSKLDKLTLLTATNKPGYWLSGIRSSRSDYFRAIAFYEILYTIVRRGNFVEELVCSSHSLVLSLVAHKDPNIARNTPRAKLMKLIMLMKDENSQFFAHISVERFLGAFDDLNLAYEEDTKTAFDAVSFIADSAGCVFAGSRLFGKIVLVLGRRDQSLDLSNELTRLANERYRKCLWVQEAQSGFGNQAYDALSLHVLRRFPNTVQTFFSKGAHLYIASRIVAGMTDSSIDLSGLIDLIYVFTDTFRGIPVSMFSLFGRNPTEQLILFWRSNAMLLRDLLVVMVGGREALMISRLLVLLTRIHPDFALFVIEEMAQLGGRFFMKAKDEQDCPYIYLYNAVVDRLLHGDQLVDTASRFISREHLIAGE